MRTRIKLAALALATIIPTAYAGTTNANFQATASLNGACTMSVDNISFGAITPALTGTATATSAIKYKCSKDIAYRISITPGSGSVYERMMKGSKGEYLTYNIYTKPEINENYIWAEGGSDNVGQVLVAKGTGTEELAPIYGFLPLNQFLTPDTYADTLIVALSY